MIFERFSPSLRLTALCVGGKNLNKHFAHRDENSFLIGLNEFLNYFPVSEALFGGNCSRIKLSHIKRAQVYLKVCQTYRKR